MMGRIKIKDLPRDTQFNRKQMRRIFGGGVTVGVNSLSVVHKGSSGVTIAFPDVCSTPTPGGPIPIPYPNIGMSSDTSGGSKKVKIGGSGVTTGSSSFSASSGDE
jgi:hypothetical protein